jgi:hypothetical protein
LGGLCSPAFFGKHKGTKTQREEKKMNNSDVNGFDIICYLFIVGCYGTGQTIP